MNVLIHSPAFLPSIGGLEIITADLASGLVEMGDDVTVVTRTQDPSGTVHPYSVSRKPSSIEFLRHTMRSDVVLHQNLSLRGAWPMLLFRRPWVVSHHSWYRRPDSSIGWQDRLKVAAIRRATGSIAVSEQIAAALSSPSVVIENGYRDELFYPDATVQRDQDLLFVGRLVSDKGVDLLLRSLPLLKGEGQHAKLTIAGAGPERVALQKLVGELGLGERVRFVGEVRDVELANLYRAHRVLVVPSRYDEPFGIVALEGIGCGCVVVGSQGGGLPRAVGPCGELFPNGDIAALSGLLSWVLGQRDLQERYLAAAPRHLAQHTRAVMVCAYREVLAAAAGVAK